MKRLKNRRCGWLIGVSVCAAAFACGFVVRSLLLPQEPAVTAEPFSTDADVDLIYKHHEPVGWVFGRVVGFQGADKPMLPRRSFPPMNGAPLARPANR